MQTEIVNIPGWAYAIRIIENGGSYSAILVTLADVVIPDAGERINVFNSSTRDSALVRAVFAFGRYYHDII